MIDTKKYDYDWKGIIIYLFLFITVFLLLFIGIYCIVYYLFPIPEESVITQTFIQTSSNEHIVSYKSLISKDEYCTLNGNPINCSEIPNNLK